MTARDALGAVLALAALAALATALERHSPKTSVAGAARAIDGDSLRVAGREIRLAGLDAPELRQTCRRDGQAYACGEAARAELRRMIAGGAVACAVQGRDKYGRDLARCSVQGEDIGASLVRRGFAVAYGDYAEEEEQARRARLGLWAGTFDPPSDWRKAHLDERR